MIEAINIGRVTAAKLEEAGIDSIEKLRITGSTQAFLRLQALDPGACLCLLYGLEGAIEGVKWNQLPAGKKHELKEFFQRHKAE